MWFARSRPVQWLGDNSYSIYLWHWPLIIAAPWLRSRGLTPAAKPAILVLSLVLAGLTKRFVEDPVRHGRPWRTRRWPAYGFAVVGVAAFLLTTSLTYLHLQRANRVQTTRAAARADAAARTALSAAAATPSEPVHNARGRAKALLPVSCFGAGAIVNATRCPHPYARPRHLDTAFAAEDGRTYQCLQPTDAATAVLCDFGRTKSPVRTIAIVGNSHARRLVPALDLYGREVGWRIIVAARINCMGLITEPIGNQDPGDSCLAWSRDVQHALLAVPDLNAVIFASFSGAKKFLLPPDASQADVRTADQRMVGTWSAFVRRGIQVIVTEDVPGMRPNPDPDCLAGSGVAYDPCAVDRATVVHSNIMTRLALQNPRLVTYLRLTQYFCDARKCHALIGGVVVYFDTDHLTLTYSRSLAPYLGAELNAALRH